MRRQRDNSEIGNFWPINIKRESNEVIEIQMSCLNMISEGSRKDLKQISTRKYRKNPKRRTQSNRIIKIEIVLKGVALVHYLNGLDRANK